MNFWKVFSYPKSAAHHPHGDGNGYPFDFDASERFTRPKTGYDFWPTHSNKDNFAKLGCVSGLLPEMDDFVWGQGYGKDPFGPIVSELPVNLQWQVTVPGLNKYAPSS
jgi:hypothetical protein